MRTRSWEEATVRDVTVGDTRALVVEPGDCTRYCVLLTRVSDGCANEAGESGGWFMRLTNFGGSGARAAYVRAGMYMLYTDAESLLGVTATGSAQLMCELIAHFTGGDVRCESWEAFEARLERDDRPEAAPLEVCPSCVARTGGIAEPPEGQHFAVALEWPVRVGGRIWPDSDDVREGGEQGLYPVARSALAPYHLVARHGEQRQPLCRLPAGSVDVLIVDGYAEEM
jgi:hypothetical protein